MTSELTLKIERLRVHACIGVLPLEKVIPQEFYVTVELRFPYDGADRMGYSINYVDVCGVVTEHMKIGCDLIEYAATRVGAALRSRWPQIRGGYVEISKPIPPMPHSVSAVSARISL